VIHPSASAAPPQLSLNAAAAASLAALQDNPAAYAAALHNRGGVTVVDCGVATAGSTELGLVMARAALGDRGQPVLFAADATDDLRKEWPDCPWPAIGVSSADPVAACLAAQYAGWKIAEDGYFAMASGPIRAAIGREELYETIGRREQPAAVVGLLEASSLPPETICTNLAASAGVPAEAVLLLVAPTASPAGTVQVVARALETALHQLLEHRFDLERIVRGTAAAPLPPVAQDDLAAIGRTNDAILYGGVVHLEVTGDDASLETIGPSAVSRHSAAHGRLFSDLFQEAGGDFYALDPGLFAPAVLEFVNLDTGRRHRFGGLEPTLVASSFGGR
jgi:methenyltetrahydromethanopterin cyclohydrolase